MKTDVVVIGAGVVGCATARELTRWNLNVAVLFALHQTTVQLPVKIGDVIIPDVASTGVDVVATANM
jgi:CxxC motif-containing protein